MPAVRPMVRHALALKDAASATPSGQLTGQRPVASRQLPPAMPWKLFVPQ